MATEMTQEEFYTLAEAAEKEGNLKGRRGKYGQEFAVFFRGKPVATATPNEDGDYQYMYLLYPG